MNKKNLILHRLNNGLYQVIGYSDKTMSSLSMFLEDGLDLDRYVNYLKDKNREKFFGNISRMQKIGQDVVIYINEDIFPGMPDFRTTIENIINILNEFVILTQLRVDRIEIILDGNELLIKGDYTVEK